MRHGLDYSTDQDEFFDYCHYKYVPKVPYAGKLRSSNLLINSFDFVKCETSFYKLVSLIREKIGLNSTVWGVKKINGNLSWEFYFYNYQKKNPNINVSNMINIVKTFFDSKIKINENMPYFMFSIDIIPALFANKKLGGIHVYIGGPNNYGFSYLLGEGGLRMENVYSFYNAKEEIKDVISRIKGSIFVDFSKIKLNEILLPKLIDCKTICVANKQGNDSVYYSGINIDQFIFFLRQFNYPKEIISFIENHKSKLGHLQYDVGFDYKMEDNKLKIIKSGYYGTF